MDPDCFANPTETHWIRRPCNAKATSEAIVDGRENSDKVWRVDKVTCRMVILGRR